MTVFKAFSLILLLASHALPALAQGCTPQGVGRTWCIAFGPGGAATNAGQDLFDWEAKRADGSKQPFDMDFEVTEGMTPEQKAIKLHASLGGAPHNASVNVCRTGHTVCMRLKPGNPLTLTDITDGKLTMSKTGQEKISVFDPPAMLTTAIIDVSGQPLGGVALLQIGDGPEVRVETANSAAVQIESALAAAFNQSYADHNLKAIVRNDRLEIPFVRCDIGISGGTTDKGLDFAVGLVDGDAGFRSRSSWVVAALAVIALAFAAFVSRQERSTN